MGLQEYRRELDEIDEQIVSLFERRMRVAEEVAQVKIQSGARVLDRKREQEKLEKLSSLTLSEFNRRGVIELYEQIMAISRKRQYQLLGEADEIRSTPFIPVDSLIDDKTRVACLGTPGSSAWEALHRFFTEDTDSVGVETFRDAMSCIEEGTADYCLLPIESSTSGIVSENYDLLYEFENYIVGEQIVTEHSKDADGAKINDIRFLIVTNRKIYPRMANKISIVIQTTDESGALYRALSHLIYNDLNMKKIESRPVRDRKEGYRFFIDFEGNIKDPSVRNALRGLRDETKSLKVLGNYHGEV